MEVRMEEGSLPRQLGAFPKYDTRAGPAFVEIEQAAGDDALEER